MCKLAVTFIGLLLFLESGVPARFLLLGGLRRRWFQEREAAVPGLPPESKLREQAAQEEEGHSSVALRGQSSVKLTSFKAGKSEIEVRLPARKQGTRETEASALQFAEEL